LTQPRLRVAIDLLETLTQAIELIHELLDPAGQLTHLRFDAVHAEFGIHRNAGVAARHGRRPAAIDLPLQHVEVALQPVEAIVGRAILAMRRYRQGGGDAERHTETRTRQ